MLLCIPPHLTSLFHCSGLLGSLSISHIFHRLKLSSVTGHCNLNLVCTVILPLNLLSHSTVFSRISCSRSTQVSYCLLCSCGSLFLLFYRTEGGSSEFCNHSGCTALAVFPADCFDYRTSPGFCFLLIRIHKRVTCNCSPE